MLGAILNGPVWKNDLHIIWSKYLQCGAGYLVFQPLEWHLCVLRGLAALALPFCSRLICFFLTKELWL